MYDYLRQSASYMIAILISRKSNNIPSLSYGSDITNAYAKIASFLHW